MLGLPAGPAILMYHRVNEPGYDPWELGMQMHQVDVEPLLEKMGIDYDPAAKYLGRHGKFIGKPAPSAVNCGVQDMIYNIKAQ